MATPASPLDDPQQIQGNVLRPFGGDRQTFLLLTFRGPRPGLRDWLRGLASRVDGTDDVGAARQGARIAGDRVLINVGLTANGLVQLRPEAAGDLAGFEAFWRGPLGGRLDDDGRLSTAPALLGDVGPSDPHGWLFGGPGHPVVDAVITIAADDDERLRWAVDRERRAAEQAGIEIPAGGEHSGQVLRDGEQRIEHFGFADGLSQPGILGFTDPARARPGTPLIAPGEFLLGLPGERRPQTWTPRPTPPEWMRGGSFQVFRRLRQDVAGWWERMADLAGPGGAPEQAAARAIGRKLDGTPLAQNAKPDHPNDFNFRDDERGVHTPRWAHIRKMNPREDDVFRDRGHKLLRRGIPFGPLFDRDRPDDRERGLLFNAYMASIEDQFEFVQRHWANDHRFPARTLADYRPGVGEEQRIDGLDPVLGDDRETARRRLGDEVVAKMPKGAFGGLVATTGAVYAFAPTRPALLRLASSDPLGPAR